MREKQLGLQEHFLNSVRRSKSPATLFLVKGVKLQGVITWFDNFSLLLRRDGTSQLVYKHAISTIMPIKPFTEPFVPAFDADAAAASPRASLQDQFLAAAASERQAMTLFLVNGVMLQGQVAAFDQFCLLLERDSQLQLVYKHAVSTLQPAQPLQLGDRAAEPEAGT